MVAKMEFELRWNPEAILLVNMLHSLDLERTRSWKDQVDPGHKGGSGGRGTMLESVLPLLTAESSWCVCLAICPYTI